MIKKRWTAVLVAVLMIFQTLGYAAFAEEQPAVVLGGKLRISGLAFVGGTLTADLSKAEPSGLTNEDVSFQWSVRDKESSRVLSSESKYTVTDSELNLQIELTVTGRADRGYSGSISAKSQPVVLTEEEASAASAASGQDNAGDTEGQAPDSDDNYAGMTLPGSENDSYETPEGASEAGYDTYGNPAEKAGTGYDEYGNPVTMNESETVYDAYGNPMPMNESETVYDAYGNTVPMNESETAYDEYGNPVPMNESETAYDESGDPAAMNGSETGFDAYGNPTGSDGAETGEEMQNLPTQAGEAYVEHPGTDTPGMEDANEVYYIYDPVTGQETVISPEPGESSMPGQEVAGGSEETILPEPAETESQADGEAHRTGAALQVAVNSENGELDFGTISEEDLSDPEVQYFTITNTGTEILHFESLAPEHFMVGDINDELGPGESVQLFIKPRESVEPGEYHDEITYRSAEGAEATIIAGVNVEPGEELFPVEDDESENSEESTGPEADQAIEYIEEPVEGTDQNSDAADTGAFQDGINPTEEGEIPAENNGADSGEEYIEEPIESGGEETEPEDVNGEGNTEPENINGGGNTEPENVNGEENTEQENVNGDEYTGPEDVNGEGNTEPEDVNGEGNTEPENVNGDGETEPGKEGGEEVSNPVGGEEGGETEDENPAQVIISLDIAPTVLDFGAETEGYEALPESQIITVSNTGSAPVILSRPSAEFFTISSEDTIEIAPGEACEFLVQPAAGLSAGEYLENIELDYQGFIPEEYEDDEQVEIVDADEAYSFDLSFVVIEKAKEYSLSVSPEGYDFGSRTAGYQDAPAAAAFTLTNTGNTDLSLSAPESLVYEISGLSASELAPGETSMFTVRPRTGLAAGDYPESLTFTAAGEDGEEMILAAVPVRFSVKNEEKVYRIVVDRTSIDFGQKEAGYAAPPAAQTVTVTNTGNTAVNIKQPSSVNYVISSLKTTTIAPGASLKFTIAPKTGLSQGQYFETITVKGDGDAAAAVNANFIVGARTVSLTGIVNPADITGLANGTAKTSQALKLPGAVTVTTTNGNMTAGVVWDTAGCVYDPGVKTAQTFNVTGRVTLPGGIKNPDNIPLITTVRVTVNARNPVIADASGNMIIGIDSSYAYTTGDKISFSASGAGYGNLSPVQGDVRFVPYCWNVLENRIWDCEPFSAAFRMGQGGNYVLKATFLQQQFNGSTWVSTGVQDVKQVNFTVRAVQTATMTPVPGQVRAARTGDDTNTLPMLIVLGAAAAAIAVAAVILIKRKRK